MSFVLDIAVVVVIALTAFNGFSKGFVRYVIKMLGTVTCLIAAFIISDMFSEPIYRDIFAPRLENALNREFEKFDIVSQVRTSMEDEGIVLEMDDKELSTVLQDGGSLASAFERSALGSGKSAQEAGQLKEQTEDFFKNKLASSLLRNAGYDDPEGLADKLDIPVAKVYDLVRAFAGDPSNQSGVKYIVTSVLDKMMISVIRYMLFIIVFVLAETLAAVIFMIAGVLDHLPAVSGANRVLGLLLGIVKGLLYVTVAALICRALSRSGAITNDSFITDSMLFGFFYTLF
ncbi:MAG: CvpA family protein [Ruminococcus sp.]|nr:CvpA family protein [Ruminococcus sp.]